LGEMWHCRRIKDEVDTWQEDSHFVTREKILEERGQGQTKGERAFLKGE